jgi:hypothetical protein
MEAKSILLLYRETETKYVKINLIHLASILVALELKPNIHELFFYYCRILCYGVWILGFSFVNGSGFESDTDPTWLHVYIGNGY